MPLSDRLTPLLSGVRLVPAGVVAARPGVPLSLALGGWSQSRATEAGVGLDVRWTVVDADGRPVPCGDAFEAPWGLGGTETTLVFPTQLHPSASHVSFMVEATVRLTRTDPSDDRIAAAPPTRLRPVTVHVAAMASTGVRALLTHLGFELAAARVGGASPAVPVPPPLELLGLPPVPVTVVVTGCTGPGGRPAIRVSAHVPLLGRVTTGAIPLPEPAPSTMRRDLVY